MQNQTKECLFYEKKEDMAVNCHLCPRNCLIQNNKRGFCNVRENIEGVLYSLVYSKPSSISLDPIEKKPLFHFYPGDKTLSIGTTGCTLACKNCQNHEISQSNPDEIQSYDMTPDDVIKLAKKQKSKIISFTYNEPFVFFEYMLEIAKLAKFNNIKTVVVTSAYVNEKPLKKILPFIDAFNVDLKTINPKVMKDLCKGDLEVVKNNLITINNSKSWLEITNLLIPTYNDSDKDIEELLNWLAKNNFKKIPIHFNAFHPSYKLEHLNSESKEKIDKALKKAIEHGFEYVYSGNLRFENRTTTFCPKCKSELIKRENGKILSFNLTGNKCKYCKEFIPGIFKQDAD